MANYEKVKSYPMLYKRDTAGRVRVWYMELGIMLSEGAYRTVSGLEDGKQVTSTWRVAHAKNIGKVNSTDSHTQAEKEIDAQYTIRLESGYFSSKDKIGEYSKFEPMLAHDFAKLKTPIDFEEQKIYSQPKLDGIRCIARADGLWTRAGKELVSIPHINKELEKVFAEFPDIIIDGELYNHDLKDDFNKITSLVRKTKPTITDHIESKQIVQYHVYDMYDTIEYDAKFDARNKRLQATVKDCDYVVSVPTVWAMAESHCNDLYADYMQSGYEGQMVRLNNVYEKKRSKGLLKRKEFITEEFCVKSVEEGQGNWSGHVKRFVITLPGGRTCGAGVRGKAGVLKELFDSGKTPDWATLRYFSLTPDGVPRFPVVIDWGYGERND